MAADILIIDDEIDIRAMLQGILEDEGFKTRQASDSEKAYAQIENAVPDLAILDIWLQNSPHDGLDILAQIKRDHPDLPVLMISGHGNIETAVKAIKMGAYDFIEKPFKTDRLLHMIDRALELTNLRRENQSLRARAEGPTELLGHSSSMTALRQALERVAHTNSRVLITGEAGTGKDLAARSIHRLSQRAAKPFMVLNCAILQPERLEEKLFGSGAQPGILEKAHGGTLLLDEVSDMPLETQGKIVRALQEQRIQRIGSMTPIEVDVRVIATTNRDLQHLMEEGAFRQDLFYRLNVVPIEMPPLRERPQDVPVLIDYFTRLYSEQAGISPCKYSESAMAMLQSYEWPGNVRQLRNVAEWVMIMGAAQGETPVKIEHLPPEINPVAGRGVDIEPAAGHMADIMALSLREARELFEKNYLETQVKRFGGNISKTAHFVEMERSALHRKIKQLGIELTTKPKQDDKALEKTSGSGLPEPADADDHKRHTA